MSVQLSILASSSAGNCALLASSKTKILIDCGLNRKRTFEGLAAAGVRPSELTAIVCGHSHGDHAGGLESVTADLALPVYLTRETSSEIAWSGRPPIREYFKPYEALRIGDIDIVPFECQHDVPNVGFRFTVEGLTIGFLTDAGVLPAETAAYLAGCDIVLLESNYDKNMLACSSHPAQVRQRIASRLGHLSNEDVAEFIRTSLDTSCSSLVLAHLSERNNHPELAKASAQAALEERGLNPTLLVASARTPSPTILY